MNDNRYNPAGVFSLLYSAGKVDERIRYLLHGDLNQMGIQEGFLVKKGMKVGRSDVYPGFETEEEYQKAIRLIWENKVEGWWNYERDLVAAGICAQDEFDAMFKK